MGWELAYSHDENGNRTGGNIDTLIKAVLAGQPVRVLMDDPNIDWKYVTQVQNLHVKGSIVYGQDTACVSCEFDGDVLKFQSDSYWWMTIFSTMGDRDTIRWSVGEHTPRGHTHGKIPMKWFVEKDKKSPRE